MKKILLILSLLSAASTARAGEIASLFSSAYDSDLIKPTATTVIDVGTLIAGNADFRLTGITSAQLCPTAVQWGEVQSTTDLSLTVAGKNLGSDLMTLLGVTEDQSNAVTSVAIGVSEAKILSAPMDKRLQSMYKQRAAGCRLVKNGTVQVTSIVTGKLKVAIDFKNGKIGLAQVTNRILDYLGNNVAVNYDARENRLTMEIYQPVTLGINAKKLDPYLEGM